MFCRVPPSDCSGSSTPTRSASRPAKNLSWRNADSTKLEFSQSKCRFYLAWKFINKLLYFEWSPTLTNYSDMVSGCFWHLEVYMAFICIYDILSGIYFDIVSGIYSDIVSDIVSGIRALHELLKRDYSTWAGTCCEIRVHWCPQWWQAGSRKNEGRKETEEERKLHLC